MQPIYSFTFKTVLSLLVLSSLHLKTHAALTLTINTVAETFSLSGSDTGTPHTSLGGSGQGSMAWTVTGTGTSGTAGNVNFDDDVVFSTSVGTPGNTTLGGTAIDTVFFYNPSLDGGFLELELGVSTDNEQTITGSGLTKSYATLNADIKGHVAGITDGTTMTLSNPPGGDWDSMTITVVPEPRVYTIVTGAALFGLLMTRKFFRSSTPAEQSI